MAGRDLYVIQSKVTGAVKVGRSDNPERRLAQLQTGSPYTLKIILIMPEGGKNERWAHQSMNHLRARQVHGGEWFLEEAIGSIPVQIWEFAQNWYMEDPDWWKRS